MHQTLTCLLCRGWKETRQEIVSHGFSNAENEIHFTLHRTADSQRDYASRRDDASSATDHLQEMQFIAEADNFWFPWAPTRVAMDECSNQKNLFMIDFTALRASCCLAIECTCWPLAVSWSPSLSTAAIKMHLLQMVGCQWRIISATCAIARRICSPVYSSWVRRSGQMIHGEMSATSPFLNYSNPILMALPSPGGLFQCYYGIPTLLLQLPKRAVVGRCCSSHCHLRCCKRRSAWSTQRTNAMLLSYL